MGGLSLSWQPLSLTGYCFIGTSPTQPLSLTLLLPPSPFTVPLLSIAQKLTVSRPHSLSSLLAVSSPSFLYLHCYIHPLPHTQPSSSSYSTTTLSLSHPHHHHLLPSPPLTIPLPKTPTFTSKTPIKASHSPSTSIFPTAKPSPSLSLPFPKKHRENPHSYPFQYTITQTEKHTVKNPSGLIHSHHYSSAYTEPTHIHHSSLTINSTVHSIKGIPILTLIKPISNSKTSQTNEKVKPFKQPIPHFHNHSRTQSKSKAKQRGRGGRRLSSVEGRGRAEGFAKRGARKAANLTTAYDVEGEAGCDRARQGEDSTEEKLAALQATPKLTKAESAKAKALAAERKRARRREEWKCGCRSRGHRFEEKLSSSAREEEDDGEGLRRRRLESEAEMVAHTAARR